MSALSAHYRTPEVVAVDERLHEVMLQSQCLHRRETVRVVLPRHPTSTTPVLFLLHGAGDDARCWLDKANLLELTAELDVMLVLAPGGRMGCYTNWSGPDSLTGLPPQWETFHVRELPDLVLPLFGCAGPWGIAGVSMGGYGALAYAAKNPRQYRVAASWSGLLHTTRFGYGRLFDAGLSREGEDTEAVWGPRNSPLWINNDTWHLADKLRDTTIYISRGDGRQTSGEQTIRGSGLLERVIGRTTDSLVARLDALGIEYTLRRARGTHDWPYWRRELAASLPLLTDALTTS